MFKCCPGSHRVTLMETVFTINLFWTTIITLFTLLPRECVFVVIENLNASIDSHPHYRFDAFSTVHTKKVENDRIASCDVPVELYAHATDTRACYIFGHPFDSDAFSTVHTNTRYTRFHFDPVLRTFSSLCFFDENAQRICVDGALVMFIQTVEYYGLVNL